jgi:hypothetical protein
MREIQAMDLASAESEILAELEAANKAERTRDGMFQDAYGEPIVVSNESTRSLARSRVAL